MKNKKGFTLIELLAVIVILAIIALISVPVVSKIIGESKKSAAKSSAIWYIEAIEKNNDYAKLGQQGYNKIISGDVLTINNLLGSQTKGNKPTSGSVVIDSTGEVTEATLCINGYNVTYENKDAEVKGKCGSSSNNNQEPEQTYTVYQPGTEVYFDPISTNKCDSSTFDLNAILAGTSTCYKWYVIYEFGDYLTVQLDHNIVNLSAWSTSSNTEGPVTALAALQIATSEWNRVARITYSYDTSLGGTNQGSNYGTLSCTNGACKIGSGEYFTTSLKARMITGEEISEITMNAGAASGTLADNWTLESLNNEYFFFSNSRYELGTRTSGTGSTNLAWLLDNTRTYADSGATANAYGDPNSGYWTLSPVSDRSNLAWLVESVGNFGRNRVNSASYGVRPVITIEKSLLN